MRKCVCGGSRRGKKHGGEIEKKVLWRVKEGVVWCAVLQRHTCQLIYGVTDVSVKLREGRRKDGRFRAVCLAARADPSWDMVFDMDVCPEALPVSFSELSTHIRCIRFRFLRMENS